MNVIFRAYYQDGEIIEWSRPQTYSHVRPTFKLVAAINECMGCLYVNHRRISTTGIDNGSGWYFGRHPDEIERDLAREEAARYE